MKFIGSDWQNYLWEVLETNRSIYNIPVILKINRTIRTEYLKKAFHHLIQRHEILRTVLFRETDGLIYQKTLTDYEAEINKADRFFQPVSDEKAVAALLEITRNAFHESTNGPFIKCWYMETGNSRSYVLLTLHSLICDRTSLSLLKKDLIQFYLSFENQENVIVEEPALQFADFSEWQAELTPETLESDLIYWKRKLKDGIKTLPIPCDRRKKEVDFSFAKYKLELSKELFHKINEFCFQYGYDKNSVCLTALKLLFMLYTDEKELCFETEIEGRLNEELLETAGPISNPALLKDEFKPDTTFLEAVRQVSDTWKEAQEHNFIPFYKMLSKIGIEYHTKEKEQSQVFYAYRQEKEDEGGFEEEELNLGWGKYDFNLLIKEYNRGICFYVTYNQNIYSKEMVTELAREWSFLMEQLITEPECPLTQLEFLNERDKDFILQKFNQSEVKYSRELTVMDLLEQQVLKFPEKTAVVSQNDQITYQELYDMSDQLAFELIRQGVKSGDYVAVFTDKRMETIIGICAIVKAGGAYVPIDPSYPQQRIDYILKDCSPKMILYSDRSFKTAGNILSINEVLQKKACIIKKKPKVTPGDLIYLLYTSGTTGEPKGVMIEQKSIIRLVHQSNFINLNEHTKILQTGTLCFDAATLEIWGALLNGGELHLADKEVFMDSRLLKKTIEEADINTMWLTVTLYNQLINADVTLFDHLKYLLIGGEKVSESHIRKLLEHNDQIILMNGYGPTETTTFAAVYPIDPKNLKYPTPIGKPISNTQIYILHGRSLCAPYMVGELCIGGDGVARGYLNSPQLTAQKFADNPFHEGIMYRSGDLARWLPDGNIEYLGRADEQIKIRGFRIELGEIEHAVKMQAGIEHAAAAVKEKDGEKYICVYFVSKEKIDIKEYRDRLRKQLPDFMMPDFFMQIDHIPITANGKLNRKALPEIAVLNSENYVEPKTETEKTAVGAFEEILDLKGIGVNDNFFEIGGHSLKAIKLLHLIEEKTGVRISLKDFFQAPTSFAISLKLQNRGQKEPEIIKAGDKEVYELSSVQKRIYAICSYDNTGIAYNVNMGIESKVDLNYNAVVTFYKMLVSRHESLRTSFVPYGDKIVQKISDDFTVHVELEELEKVDEEEKMNQMTSFIRPFDLQKAPLIRMKLIKVKYGWDILLFDTHHIISDGMSLNLILKEFMESREGKSLYPVEFQYKDYSEWQNQRDFSEQKDFWLKEFQGDLPVLDLYNDSKRSQLKNFYGNCEIGKIKKEIKTALKAFCKENGMTEYMVLFSAFFILMSKYANQEDMILGSPVSGRVHRQTENILGMFVNTLAIRAQPQGQKTVWQFLQEMREKCFMAQENQEFPLEELLKELDIKRESSRNPLFDVVFNFQNIVNSFSGEQFKILKPRRNISKFDLTFTINNEKEEYKIELEYCKDLFGKDLIRCMMDQYQAALKAMLHHPEETLSKLQTFDSQEKKRILHEFNKPVPAPGIKPISSLFEEQVKHDPDKIAVSFNDIVLTYEELNKKANALALKLRALGVGKDDFVAIIAERRIETIVAMLSVVKAGGAYVPIDPAYPIDRIEFMLEDCRPRAVLSCDSYEKSEIPVLNISSLMTLKGEEKNLSCLNFVTDLVYLIYTSGTSGKPKGTMIEQRSVIGLVKHADYARLKEDTIILQTGSLSFDAATFEIWGTLLNGGQLCITKDDVILDSDKLKAAIRYHHVNTMFITTALFNQLINSDGTVFDDLDTLLFGGEITSEIHVKKLLHNNDKLNLVNVYGPTETTTFASWYPIKGTQVKEKTPIGRPIANAQIYIEKNGELCGIGMAGELCIAGNGVGRGYFNQKELTDRKFTVNPYGNGFLYHSGDLARWRPDGNIEFIGRMDEQIKLRGFRIELGEIEAVIRSQKKVLDAAVILREEDGERYLCAYVAAGTKLDIKGLKSLLAKELPGYMVPAYMMQLKKIPVTRNGKLDKKALPKIILKSEQSYEAPKSSREQTIINIFEEILGVDLIGMKDNFYEMGGDSIKAIRVAAKLRERGYELSIRDIMQMRIMEQIIPKVKFISEAARYEQGEVTGEAELTPIQQSFFHWNLSNPNHFNQSVMLKSKEGFEKEVLVNTITKLLSHHDILRTVFHDNKMIIRDMNAPNVFSFEAFDCTERAGTQLAEYIEETGSKIQASLNIYQGPLIKTALFSAADQDYFMISIHHLVVDGISWRIILEDFCNGYQQELCGNCIQLPEKTASYITWSKTLQQFAKSTVLQKEIPYWSRINKEMEFYNGTICPDADRVENGYGTTGFLLSETLTRDLLYQAGQAYHTEINDILLAALGSAGRRWTGNRKIPLHLEGHGREEIHDEIDITRTVGWFTSIFPILLEAFDDKEKMLIATKEMLRHIPNRGMGYGVIVNSNDYELEESKAEICFNYLGQWKEEFSPGNCIEISEMTCGMDIAESNRLNNNISVNGQVVNDKLSISILYDRNKYNTTSIDRFCNFYKVSLSEFIEFCTSKNESVKTASDYNEELTEDVLDELLTLF